jgi:REP element-mobilizing transposase RayT
MAKFSPDEYRHESNAVSLLNYHFVFIPKRRKKVLVGAIAERLQQIICELVIENRWKIIAMEIMPDHVHLFCRPARLPMLGIKRWSGYLKERITKRLHGQMCGNGSAQLRPPVNQRNAKNRKWRARLCRAVAGAPKRRYVARDVMLRRGMIMGNGRRFRTRRADHAT